MPCCYFVCRLWLWGVAPSWPITARPKYCYVVVWYVKAWWIWTHIWIGSQWRHIALPAYMWNLELASNCRNDVSLNNRKRFSFALHHLLIVIQDRLVVSPAHQRTLSRMMLAVHLHLVLLHFRLIEDFLSLLILYLYPSTSGSSLSNSVMYSSAFQSIAC